MRQQEVNRRRAELQQRLIGGDGIVVDVDRAQDAAVALPELRRLQEIQAIGDRAEAIMAVGVAAVAAHRFGVTVQADTDLDMKALERLEHRPFEHGPVGLQRQVHLRRHPGRECLRQIGQPWRSRQQRLAAVKDDVNALQTVAFRVLGNALDGFLSYPTAHALRHLPPRLIRHLIDVAVRTRQITTTVDFQDELPERDGLVPGGAYRGHVQVEQRPRRGMFGY